MRKLGYAILFRNVASRETDFPKQDPEPFSVDGVQLRPLIFGTELQKEAL